MAGNRQTAWVARNRQPPWVARNRQTTWVAATNRPSIAATKVIESNAMMFIISGFLPGEYVLRTFPLLCKAAQLLRLSLSLLGPLTGTSPSSYLNSEGSIDGIYSKRQEFKRILKRGHLITALWVEESEILLNCKINHQNSNSNERKNDNNFEDNNNSHTNSTMSKFTTFSFVKDLYLSSPNSLAFSPTQFSFSLSYFPRLSKLVVDQIAARDTVEQLLLAIWKLPLTSLSMTKTERDINFLKAKPYINGDHNFPAFSHTLISLKTDISYLLWMLSPYCRNLQHLDIPDEHSILINNPGLTSLSLSYSSFFENYYEESCDSFPIDLPPYSQLTKLHISQPRRVVSEAIYSSLEEVTLDDPDKDSISQFLSTQCPALTRVSITVYNWQSIIKITSVLNPDKCKQLTLQLKRNGEHPSLDEVEKLILQKGFKINDEFLLSTRDAAEQWGRIVQIAPHLTGVTPFLIFPHRFASIFTSLQHQYQQQQQHLVMLDFSSNMVSVPWTQEMLSCIGETCLTLKVLKVRSDTFSGDILQLHSSSLRQLFLNFDSLCKGFNLILPNLKRLSLELLRGEGILLRELLNWYHPQQNEWGYYDVIEMPRLRVLSIHLQQNFFFDEKCHVASVACETGHSSLTELTMIGNRNAEIFCITLQNVPCLRAIKLHNLPGGHVHLDVPGDCDISLTANVSDELYAVRPYSYAHNGWSKQSSNFMKNIYFHQFGKRWVESLPSLFQLSSNANYFRFCTDYFDHDDDDNDYADDDETDDWNWTSENSGVEKRWLDEHAWREIEEHENKQNKKFTKKQKEKSKNKKSRKYIQE